MGLTLMSVRIRRINSRRVVELDHARGALLWLLLLDNVPVQLGEHVAVPEALDTERHLGGAHGGLGLARADDDKEHVLVLSVSPKEGQLLTKRRRLARSTCDSISVSTPTSTSPSSSSCSMATMAGESSGSFGGGGGGGVGTFAACAAPLGAWCWRGGAGMGGEEAGGRTGAGCGVVRIPPDFLPALIPAASSSASALLCQFLADMLTHVMANNVSSPRISLISWLRKRSML